VRHNPNVSDDPMLLTRTLRTEAVMKYALGSLFVVAGGIGGPNGSTEPLDATCSASATQATGYTPGTDTGPDASRVAGAAKRAAAGAAFGAVQNNQYDNASGGLKDANRGGQGTFRRGGRHRGGGGAQPAGRRQNRKSEDASQLSYDARLAQKPK